MEDVEPKCLKRVEQKPFLQPVSEKKLWLPQGISSVSQRYDISVYNDTLYDFYGVVRPAWFERAVTVRKAEFLAGRILARSLLDDYGCTNENVHIGRYREPIWPNGFAGSLSHCSGYVICVVGKASACAGIGVDVMTPYVLNDLSAIRDIPTLVQDAHAINLKPIFQNTDLAYALAFSLRESVYKAVFPHMEIFLDFDSVEIIDVSARDCHIRLVPTLHNPKLHSLFNAFECTYNINDIYGIRTFCKL